MNKKLCAAITLGASLLNASISQGEELHYQVGTQIISAHAPRLGVNLGDWSSWGAAQFSANILMNPGFEGIIDRAIVIVKAADARGFSDDSSWTQRPDGFWAGAKFAVRSGASAGTEGVLFDSLAVGKLGLPEFKAKGKAPALNPGDVVSLTQINDKGLPSQWWFSKDLLPGQLSVINNDRHPGGKGLRTLALKPLPGKPVEALTYLDAIGDRAGKLLPVNDLWTVRFWMRQTEPGAGITVRFRRLNGDTAFYQETFHATTQWQLFERRFNAKDQGKPGTLELSLRAEGNSGNIILDDIALGSAARTDASIFRPELITALKRLRPGYLRDWQGQLGDTFDNRTADVFARRATRYRPGEDSTFSYNLKEFLQLAKAIEAQPWLIIPPTLGDQELQDLGRYLSGQINAFHFQEMWVEFGNENWNTLFRPAGIPDHQAHGLVATRAFLQLLQGANHHPALHTVVNGQYVNPWASQKFLAGVSNAQALAVAPYFLFTLEAGDDPLSALFAQDDFFHETLAATQAQNKELLIYEVNLHTTSGSASLAARDIATTSSAAGAALAKRLLTALNLGIKRQCLYTLAQFDTFITSASEQRELVKLWGIVRDLGGTQRLRPTGLVMALLNQALPADIYPVKSLALQADKAITLSAFHNAKGWGFAAVSAKGSPQPLTLHLPTASQKQTWRLLRMDSPSPTSNNEESDNVHIVEEPLLAKNGSVSVAVPPYGFVLALAAQ